MLLLISNHYSRVFLYMYFRVLIFHKIVIAWVTSAEIHDLEFTHVKTSFAISWATVLADPDLFVS